MKAKTVNYYIVQRLQEHKELGWIDYYTCNNRADAIFQFNMAETHKTKPGEFRVIKQAVDIVPQEHYEVILGKKDGN